jgi:hypothetical protein
MTTSPNRRMRARVLHRDQAGAASAEYAAVTAAGVGIAGVLIRLLTSDFGQQLLRTIVEFFLQMVGVS